MRAGVTKKISAQNQLLLLRALAGAFLLLALRVEPAAACAADAASNIICRRTSSNQRALMTANFMELHDVGSNATIALHGAGQACTATPACPCPAPAAQLKPPALRAGREPADLIIIFSKYYNYNYN